MSAWIATTWDHPDGDGVTAMIVQAATEREAAAIAAECFTDHDDYSDALPIRNVFVVPWDDRTAYRVGCSAERAELQCCGGGQGIEYAGADGHWATCPTVAEDSTGSGDRA